MPKYSVNCFSPPADLSIKKGEKVKVRGQMRANLILAESIENLTQSGPTCHCGSPTVSEKDTYMQLKILPKWVEKIGIIKSVNVTASGIFFEIEAP